MCWCWWLGCAREIASNGYVNMLVMEGGKVVWVNRVAGQKRDTDELMTASLIF